MEKKKSICNSERRQHLYLAKTFLQYATILALNLFPMGVDVAQENRCFSIIPGGHYLSKFNIICLRNPLKVSCTLF